MSGIPDNTINSDDAEQQDKITSVGLQKNASALECKTALNILYKAYIDLNPISGAFPSKDMTDITLTSEKGIVWTLKFDRISSNKALAARTADFINKLESHNDDPKSYSLLGETAVRLYFDKPALISAINNVAKSLGPDVIQQVAAVDQCMAK